MADRQVSLTRNPCVVDVLCDETKNPPSFRQMPEKFRTDPLTLNPFVRRGLGLEEWYLPGELGELDEHGLLETRMPHNVDVLTKATWFL